LAVLSSPPPETVAMLVNDAGALSARGRSRQNRVAAAIGQDVASRGRDGLALTVTVQPLMAPLLGAPGQPVGSVSRD